MTYGPVRVFPVTITSGGSSGSVDLTKSYSKVFIEVPTMSTQVELTVYGSRDDSTYRVFKYPAVSGTVTPDDVVVGTGCSGAMLEIPCHTRYLKVVASAVVIGGAAIYLHCID